MARSLWTSLFLLANLAAMAGEVEHTQVRHEDGIYYLELEVVLAADHQPVWAIISDYDQLQRISDMLIDSALVSEPGAAIKQRRLVTQTCILVFCFTAKMVEDVWEKDYSVSTRIIPGLSDFDSGKTLWRLVPVAPGQSRLEINSELEPAFWIPPFIGPYLLKRKMLKEAKQSVMQIEALATDG